MSKTAKIRSAGTRVKEGLSGHFTNLFLLIITVAVIFLAHDVIMSRALIPAYSWLKGIPVIGAAFIWLESWAGTWDWDKIVFIFMSVVAGVVLKTVWDRKRGVEDVVINPEAKKEVPKSTEAIPPAPTPTEAEKKTEEKLKTTEEELTKVKTQLEELTKKLAEQSGSK